MITPPDPGIPALLLVAAARLGWIPVAGALGRLDGELLTVVRGDAPGTVRWHAGPELPERCGPRLLSRAAYEALRAGELQADGTLMHEGRRWRLVDVWTGEGFAAELFAAEHTAAC